ncbi:hypothetical protein VKT23_001524 [Stygiomarasmius scandens]|uniref:F-box domain-containing protein n=1 Tax=Marasmiellus scandens TaxID=2682957 RepID=A0ABR1JZ39_9AGAR
MDSPFSHLFNANQPVSLVDIPVIHDLLSKLLEKLQHLDFEIIRSETTLARLKRERRDVEKYVKAHQRLLSPIVRLPSEILSEIFVCCLPEDRHPTCSASNAPLSLGLVCQRWREVCLSTPRLWSSVHVVIPMNDGADSIALTNARIKKRRLGVESWLERSGLLPLSFSIYGKNLYGGGEEVEQLFQCFTRRIHRWKSVEFQLSLYCSEMFESAIASSAGSDWEVPLLDSFTFDLLEANSTWGSDLVSIPKFLAAPNLRQVSVTNDIPDVLKHLEQSNLDLVQLQLRDGSLLTPRHVFSPLLKGSNLRVCHLDVLKGANAETFLWRLTPTIDQPEPLCPKLQQFTVVAGDMKDELLVDLARSRSNGTFTGVALLKVLRVVIQKRSKQSRTPETERAMIELWRKGMEVVITYLREPWNAGPSFGQRAFGEHNRISDIL